MGGSCIGEIRTFARHEPAPGWLPCDGRELAIDDHQPLFALIGWRFGGDLRTTFRLPTLRAQATAPTAGLVHAIAERGHYPTGGNTMLHGVSVGEIRFFAGRVTPSGWVPCDGRVLPIQPPYIELYEAIGRRWGGDVETFGIPNFRDAPDGGATENVARFSYLVAVAGPLPPGPR
jgi:microcystin-dependent protein